MLSENQLIRWRQYLGLLSDDKSYDELLQREYQIAVDTGTRMSLQRIKEIITGEKCIIGL